MRAEESSKPSVRRSTSSLRQNPPGVELLDQFIRVMQEVEEAVIDDRTKSLFTGFKYVTLTKEQKCRRWSKDRVPTTPQWQICPNCNHRSTNLPIENDAVDLHNKQLNETFQKDLKLWQEYEKAKAKGDHRARKPAHLNRCPRDTRNGSFKQHIIMCMCSTSFCTSVRDDTTNHCPIKCMRDKTTPKEQQTQENNNNCIVVDDEQQKERYPFEGSPYPKCTCPICACKCNFACTLQQFGTVLSKTRNLGGGENFNTTNGQPTNPTSSSSSTNIKNILSEALKTGFTEMRANLRRQQAREIIELCNSSSSSASSSPNNDKSIKISQAIEQQCKSLICETAASNIVMESPKIDMSEKLQMQQEMGASTTVQLPGCVFDTRNIMSGATHGKHNRLGTTKERKVLPGMITNLDIDFSVLSDEYLKQAEAAKSAAAKMSSGMHESKNFVDLMSIESNSPRENDNTTAVKTEASSSVVDGTDDVILKMHHQIVRLARSSMTRLMDDVIENGNSEEKRMERRRIMKRIKLIEKSEQMGTHLNNIKCVTDNGDRLVGTAPMSSQDVLKRVNIILSDAEEDE